MLKTERLMIIDLQHAYAWQKHWRKNTTAVFIIHCYHNHIQERNHGHTGVTRENKVVNFKANVLSYKIQEHVYVRYIRAYLLPWNVGTSSNLSSHASSKNQFSKTSYSWSCNRCTSKLQRLISAYIKIIIIIIISLNIVIDEQSLLGSGWS